MVEINCIWNKFYNTEMLLDNNQSTIEYVELATHSTKYMSEVDFTKYIKMSGSRFCVFRKLDFSWIVSSISTS